MTDLAWSYLISWETLRAGGRLHLEAGEQERGRIAQLFDLMSLETLEAELTFTPWLDGAEIRSSFRGRATRACGLSLEPLDEAVADTVVFRVAPLSDSRTAEPASEIIVSLEESDPPDIIAGTKVDVGHYVVEAFGLALNPFPRKAGAVFVDEQADPPLSPFTALRAFKGRQP